MRTSLALPQMVPPAIAMEWLYTCNEIPGRRDLQSLILLHGHRVQSIDVNPLSVSDNECVAVAALIVPKLS